MGRDVRRHADGDAAGTVHEEIGELGREDGWLFQRPVEVVHPVNRVLLQVFEHCLRGLREAAFRVPHRGGLVLRAPPVSLSVDQGVSEGEALDHPRERVIYREVSMRMPLPKALAGRTSSLLVLRPSAY